MLKTATFQLYLHGKVPQRLVSGVCLGGLLLSVALPLSHAAERQPSQAEARSSETSQVAQEHFLQHFISRSLQPETTGQDTAVTPTATPQVSPPPTPLASLTVPERPTSSLTTVATKMVFSLGVLVALLIAGAYLVRRYLVPQTLLGRRGALLRVVAKVPLTPKATIALVEVPGTVLVVGITGTTLTALGEVEPSVIEPQAQESEPEKPLSFPAILDQQSQEEPPNPDESVLHVPAAIQKKLKALKRL